MADRTEHVCRSTLFRPGEDECGGCWAEKQQKKVTVVIADEGDEVTGPFWVARVGALSASGSTPAKALTIVARKFAKENP